MTDFDWQGAVETWLESLAGEAGDRELVVAFSGGLDSTVLLAALVRAGLGKRLKAVHVDHGLQPEAGDWAAHCQDVMAALGVSGAVERLRLMPGPNLEDRARQARYRALARHVPDDAWLVLAHHRDDQAETLLLRMLRGASVHGLAAMRTHQLRDGLYLWRPLLDQPRERLRQLARDWQLEWVEDPSNQDSGPDRNFLRNSVMPRLASRWPVNQRLAATAHACAEAADLLAELAAQDAEDIMHGETLRLPPLLALSPRRRDNLLAWWMRQQGLQVPGRDLLRQLHDEVMQAGADRTPRLVMGEHVWCRYREDLYLLPRQKLEALTGEREWAPQPGDSLSLGPVTVRALGAPGELTLCQPAVPLTVRPARGGERILLDGMHRQVSELWRRAALPPWQRQRLPLFLAGEEVVAATGIGVADNWRPESGAPVLGLSVEE